MPCPFAALGLEPTATLAEVKHAFHRLALEAHPDQGGDPVAFRELHENYKRAIALVGRPEPITRENAPTWGWGFVAPSSFHTHVKVEPVCATCNGTGKVRKGRGFFFIELPCPDC